MLSFVHEIAVGLRDGFLDSCLLAGEHQFFELAMRRQQHIRRRCLERHSPFGADHGIAQMNAGGPMPKGPASSSSLSMTATGVIRSPSTLVGMPAVKPTV